MRDKFKMLFTGLIFISIVAYIHVDASPYTPECNEKLLENRDFVPDSAFSESSFEENFKGQYARDSTNDEQAWCPLNKISTILKEFVSIDLGRLSVIKMIMTRGRNTVGYFSAQSYFIKYKQENQSEWKFYKNYSGSQELIGRKDPLNEKFTSLEPPLIARWLRLYPYQTTNEKICLKLQLYGCINTNHVVEYRMADGSKYYPGQNPVRFRDTTYDGILLNNGTLIGGIGKLSDRDIEGNTASSPIVDGAKEFVGWDRDQLKAPFVSLVFRFDGPRNFSALSVRVANLFDYHIRVFKMIEMTFGWGFDGTKILHETGRQKESIENDDRIRIGRWKEIKINNHFGTFVKIDLYFASQWIILSEIYFHSEQLTSGGETFPNRFVTDKPINIKYPNQISEHSINFSFNMMPLAHTLGLICGILGIIILLGFILLLYMHNRRKRNSPTKERVIQLKYPDDENVFLTNENQFYSSKLNKGTIIPFNISPYKYCTNQRSFKNIPSSTQGLLTPTHNIVNINSPKVIIKSSPIHNPRGIDSCIYTSLPASDTESLGTPDRKSNNFQQLLPSVIQNSPVPCYWNNQSIRGSISPDKIFYNSNNIDDNTSYTFQCFRDSQIAKELSNMGLIYTNQSNCQEYDSFKSPTLNDTDPESESIINKCSSDLYLPIEDSIAGCCGNSTIAGSSDNLTKGTSGLIPHLRIDNLNDLAPLGSGRWGEMFIDISFPTEFEFQYNTQRGELNPSCDFNGWESRAALVKILDENAPLEIRERFYKEYSIAVLINHENICRILAANFDSSISRPFVISEYSVHGNLFNYFQNICYGSKFNFFDSTLGFERTSSFSHQQTVMIILQLAKALKYMEDLELIHRDVACRNCLLFHLADGELKIKLTDSAMSQTQFSFCYVRPKSILQTLSLSHQPVSISSTILPLRWSACESITDNQFSAKSDVYAFGITAWEIFTRCKTYPFSESSDEQLVLNAVNLVNNHIEKLTPLSLPSQCAKEMNDFIQQCVQPLPLNRPNFHDICTFLQNKINRSV